MPALRLILVSPKYAGNVGFTARVAANFGVTDFWIVDPPCDPFNSDATRVATGRSIEVLKGARVVATLAEALQDCHAAIAIARRVGNVSPPVLEFEECADFIAKRDESAKVALVFGREDNCLTVEEMLLCERQLPIPTAELMPTMNLSHAVATVLSRIFVDAKQAKRKTKKPSAQKAPSTTAQFEGLMDHWRLMMQDAGIYKAGNPERVLVRLRRALQKADLTAREVALLRALLSKTQVAMGKRSRKGNNSSGG